jgi:hypothetical protein
MSFLLDCSLGKTLSRLNLLDNLARAPLTFAITGLRQLRLQANMLQSSGASRLLCIVIADRNSNIEMKHIFAYSKLRVECNRRVIPDVRLYENNIGCSRYSNLL